MTFRKYTPVRMFMAAAALAYGIFCAWPVESLTSQEKLRFENEADSFLESLPDGLQDRQANAVMRAISGDYSRLLGVRNSRNKAPQISESVDTAAIMIPSAAGHLIPARLYKPKSPASAALPLLVYCHGGGWTFGSINSCAAICDAIAASGKAMVLAIDYRLAPEHPYPAALDDVADAVSFARRELVANGEPLAVGGDSSGGNLAIACALRLANKAEEQENTQAATDGLIAIYPVIKAEPTDDSSWISYNRTYGLDAPLMEAFNYAYTGNVESIVHNPEVSPGYADADMLRNLPPALIINAGRDILADQGTLFHEALLNAGARSHHETIPGAVHLFATVPGQPAAFDRTVRLIIDYMSSLR